MGYYNGYAGYYKGNEDEYENLTMSPWVEDVMEAIEKSKLSSPKKVQLREMLIESSYDQKENVKAVLESLTKMKEDENVAGEESIYESIIKALASEEELVKIL